MRIRSKHGQSDGTDEIYFNLTPMIDCLLMIIFFYMLSSTFLSMEKQMDLNLPEAKSGHPEKTATKEIIINVLADGRMKVGDSYVEMDQLVDHLKQVAMADQDTPVTIRGDRATVLQNAVRAMDACGRANLRHISVGLLDDGHAHGGAGR